jgi:hypothetical protein
MTSPAFMTRETGMPRFGRAVVLEQLLPQLTGITLPDFIASDIDATEELIEALGLAWDFGSKG